MNDKQSAENMWKTVEFLRTLTSDPAEQAKAAMNAQSFIQNELAAEVLRQTLANILGGK